ncbi:transcriptional regulator family: RFX DNA-binding domain [Trichoderma aggressivum f. europaeum]|uniref:Transcriptional regulator family: RFX DNA-binding domain n=1 Tax=Trichoderma aggressivum f. europaeum TaxID=173218 RepID=A0AAE1LW50_9HYPO|nr:transcriptional regulator family: RFX DNA-binding domain [Trichoderma aggressivum f. europaeum]
MEQDNSATRATAKARKRPLSRASTTSIHSAATQSNLDQTAFAEASSLYTGQWIPSEHHGHSKDMGAAPQMSPEDMILQAATHMQSSNHDFSIDGSMGPAMAHHMQYQQHHTMTRHPLPAEQYGANASFTEGDSQMLDREENEDADSMTGAAGAVKTATRSSANNELEMRHLYSANRHRSLQDVARELHGNERGPNSERTRQVFAMLWINSVCSKGKGSVPRGRVYANYASRCATERITVLNPASFGKLVRVLFPGLKTRRLGVRGESKYHYVNFAIAEDQPEAKEPLPQPPRALPEAAAGLSQSLGVPTQPGNNNVRRDVLPSPQTATQPQINPLPTKSSNRSHSLYNHPDLSNIDNVNATSNKTELQLAFPPPDESAFEQSEPIALPPIESYLPHGTDPDAAKSLSALYRSHCTSLVECIRYCREKTFFHLYTSFQGTLTMPVQKLFGHPALAPWIEGCDIALYQRMMRIVSGLTLQVVPKPVLDTLRNISERLVPHIRDSFQGQPQHVITAKESPAAIFAALLDRALRVNLTAHAAANMLSNPANRDQMYVDWITMIRARKIAECVPTRGMDDVVTLLVTEIRDLLDPANVPWEVECLTIYGDVVTRSGRQSDADAGVDTSGQNVLDRWVNFLQSLPAKFPYASHADIVWCVERVGTAVMRDLTLAQGKSFGSWWVTKTWVDEMTCFLAEQGGFMKESAKAPMPAAEPQSQVSSKPTSRQVSRYSSGSDDVSVAHVSHTQPGRAPFPPPNNTNSAPMIADSHDDSGIGIRTPEEDFPMDKFTFAGAEGQGLELAAGASL